MRPRPLRHALGRAPRAVAVALAGGVLLAGCSTGGGNDGTGDASGGSGPVGTSQPATPPGTGPAPPEQTEDPDMDEDAGTTEPGSTQPPGGAPGPTGTPAGALSEQDSGAQVALRVGEERPLQLGSAWSWSEPVVEGAAVTLTPVDFLVDPGYVEWLVTGAAAGSATLEVVGEPVCGDTTVCPPTTVTLDVEVTD